MREALYHPERGYYAGCVGIGKSGDFSTTSTLSPVLGEAIAAWVVERKRELFGDEPCAVIELGPGTCALMQSVAAALCSENSDTPSVANAIRFCTVETSPVFRDALKRDNLLSECIENFDTLVGALKACDGRALIYSNEFPDAFPAVQLAYREGGWWEVFVDLKEGGPVEVFEPLTRGIDADAPNRVREGQRLYIHPSYHEYLQKSLPLLKQGAMLTIDYGRAYPSSECRAYSGHQRYEGLDVYAHMGERDITCDVNFTDLKRWGEQLGLQTASVQTQAEFLATHIPDLEKRAKDDEAIAFLTNPLGAGGAFMCLDQRVQTCGDG